MAMITCSGSSSNPETADGCTDVVHIGEAGCAGQNSQDNEMGDLLARFLANVFKLAIAARCSWRMLCFLAATTALPASERGPQWEALGVSKRSIEARVLL